jgi:hypothetical protein
LSGMHAVGEIRALFSAEVLNWGKSISIEINQRVVFDIYLLASDKFCEFQLILRSTTKYFAEGSILADSRELSKGLMVITSGSVGIELPMDSAEADEENCKPDGSTLLYIFGRGCGA